MCPSSFESEVFSIIVIPQQNQWWYVKKLQLKEQHTKKKSSLYFFSTCNAVVKIKKTKKQNKWMNKKEDILFLPLKTWKMKFGNELKWLKI